MASKPDGARNSSGIERVGKRKKGYSVEQVNDFLEHAHSLYESNDIRLTQEDIQDVSFDLEDNGYAIPQVDAALSRLERAVVDKTTEYEISHRGKVVWKAQADEEYRVLLSHANRDYKVRFDYGESRRPSYDKKQVDNIVDKSLDKIAILLGHKACFENSEKDLSGIDAMFVSNVLFTQRSGKHGYDERQVDYYLNACVRLLSRLESYDRVSKYTDFTEFADSDSGDYSNDFAKQDSFDKPESGVKPDSGESLMPPSYSPAQSSYSKGSAVPKAPSQDFAKREESVQAAPVQAAPEPMPVSFAPVQSQAVPQSQVAAPAASPEPSPSPVPVAPVQETNHEQSDSAIHAQDAQNKEDATNASSANNANNTNNATNSNKTDSVGDLNLSLLASPKFEPSQRLNLDIPDLSFPVMNHFDTSLEDSSHNPNNDSYDFDDTGESDFGGFVNPNHN